MNVTNARNCLSIYQNVPADRKKQLEKKPKLVLIFCVFTLERAESLYLAYNYTINIQILLDY